MTDQTLFGNTIPALPNNGIESPEINLGFVFTVAKSGFVKGWRQYHVVGKTLDTMIGALWDFQKKRLMGSKGIVGASSSDPTGWYQQLFDTPLYVLANYPYILAVYAPGWDYPSNANKFDVDVINGDIKGLSSISVPAAVSAGNGVYNYNAGLIFPPYASGNGGWYGQDLIFEPSPALPYETLFDELQPTDVGGNGGNPLNLGLDFQVTADGWIYGLRFYKDVSDVGTHQMGLWDDAGVLIDSITFSGETASGWQQQLFPSPVQVHSGDKMTVSKLCPSGNFAKFEYFMDNLDRNNGHSLIAARNGAGGIENGRYVVSATLDYPVNSFHSTNYLVDVAFSTSYPTPPSPPSDNSQVALYNKFLLDLV